VDEAAMWQQNATERIGNVSGLSSPARLTSIYHLFQKATI
jgi:hypothetical protein